MGNSNSIPKQIEANKLVLPKDNPDEDELIAEYLFNETDNLKSLPSIEEPIKIANNPIVNEKKKRFEKKLNDLDAIENQIIKYIAENNNIIIDEYDLYTLITVISSILDDQNLLIFSENTIIGKIYENFADTPAKIRLYTKNITCNTSNSKITDITLYDTIDMNLYDIIILVINDQVPKEIIHEIVQICSQINKQVIVYRLFPSHGYADQIFIDEFGENFKYLTGTKRRTSNYVMNNCSEINFDDCIGMFLSHSRKCTSNN